MTAQSIIEAVAEKHSVKVSAIYRGGGRHPKHLAARSEAMALMRTDLGMSYPQIAAACGGFHHTSVIYLIRRSWSLSRAITLQELTAVVLQLQERIEQLEARQR